MSHDPYANPRKTTTIRRLGAVDIAALKAAVLAIPEAVWDAENADKPNRFEALDKTRHIVFRFVDSTRDWRGSHDRPAWAEWQPLLAPVMQAAVISDALAMTASVLNEDNPAAQLVTMVKKIQRDFAASPLPTDRASFESRARLFYFLEDFSRLLQLKRNFNHIISSQN